MKGWMLDDVDFRLIAHLIREPFASNAALGRAVHLSGTAARARLERLRASGVLLGHRLLPAADALGRTHAMWTYPAVPKPPDVARILDLDDVAWVVEWHDGSWTIHSFVAGTSAEPLRMLDTIMGSGGVDARPHTEADAPDRSPSRVLSPLDWRLIAALVEDPRASVVALSKACGLSPKFVRRRRAALVANGHVLIVPEIAYGAARGVVLFDLVVALDRPMGRPALARLVPEGVLLRSNQTPPSGFFLCRAGSVQEIAALERRLSGAEGVSHVEARFPVRRAFAAERIRTWIGEENRRWAGRRLGEPPARLSDLGPT